MVHSGCYRFLISLFSAELPGIRIGLRGAGGKAVPASREKVDGFLSSPACPLRSSNDSGMGCHFQAFA